MSESTIKMEHVVKAFGDKVVLQDVSLDIQNAEIFGILGPSGCGKTTAIKVITGQHPCNEGKVLILGEEMPKFDLLRRIGYMAQGDALYLELTARENLEFFGQIYGMSKEKIRQRIEETLEMVDLLPHIDVQVKNYSGGMKRRLSLAGALLHEPEVIVLDEPTVGIDPLLRKRIWDELEKLSQAGVTILMTTHVMDEADKCDRLAMMRNGKIIGEGTCQELMDAVGAATIEEAFIIYGGGAHARTGIGTEDPATAEA